MISLDHRFRKGDSPQVIWPRCFCYTPLGTLLPRRIFLAEPDCEKASARGHLLERYGYEVLSCCDALSISKCFEGMAQYANCRKFVNLIMCDVSVLDETLTGFIQTTCKTIWVFWFTYHCAKFHQGFNKIGITTCVKKVFSIFFN